MFAIIVFFQESVTILGVLLSSFYIFKKALNYFPKTLHKIISILWCVGLSFLYAFSLSWTPLPVIRPVLCIVSLVFILFITKIKPIEVISAYFLSFGISYVLSYMAFAPVTLLIMPFASAEYQSSSAFSYDKPIYILIYTLVSVLQLFLAYLIFRIRRFRKGFPFLFKKYAIILSFLFVTIVLVFVTWVKTANATHDTFAIQLLFTGILITGIFIIVGIRRGISMFQWQKIMLRNIELLEQALADEKEKNRHLMRKIESAQGASHRVIRRLEAMEYKVAQQTANTEYSQDFVTIDDIQKLQKEFQEDVVRTKGRNILPSVKIKEIDNLFEYFSQQFYDNEIGFILKVNGSIPYMTEHIIDQSKLETMIGDHLHDALAAVKASGNPFRSVLAGFGLIGDCYELTISDSGIPFEVDTLVRLGVEYVTTHADSGGNGIGFVTTFEVMREYGASLIICEQHPGTVNYTKSVTIRFDGKKRYIIKTYRPDDFPPNDRYEIAAHE